MEIPKIFCSLRKITNPHKIFICYILLLIIAPWVASKYLINILIVANIFAILAMSWDILTGFTGQINFGASFLVGLGAYASALLSVHTDLPLIVCILGGSLAAIIGGLLLAIPALRLKGPYLGLVTFAAQLILMRVVMIYSSFTGGEIGIPGLKEIGAGDTIRYFYSTFLMLIAGMFFYWIAFYTKMGKVFLAIKNDEEAAEEIGFNIAKFKIISFAISSAFSGLAGAFLVHYLMSVSPDSVLETSVTVEIIIASIVGGLGTIWGPIAGSYFLVVGKEYLRPFAEWRMFTFVLLALLILLFSPGGMAEYLKRVGYKFLSKTRNND